MNEYQAHALDQALMFYIAPCIISFIFLCFDKSENVIQRLSVSSHGMVFIFASVFSIIASTQTKTKDWDLEGSIFVLILCLGFLSIFYSLFKFSGSKWLHLLHLVHIPSALIILFIGSMTLSHDWI